MKSFYASFRPCLSHCLAHSEFYSIVEYRSGEFVNNTLGSYSIHGDPLVKPLDAVPASDSEYVRIERTLYRFEIFCQIFGSAQLTCTEEEEALMDEYLSRFSPWEHEQLATIRDFMFEIDNHGANNVTRLL